MTRVVTLMLGRHNRVRLDIIVYSAVELWEFISALTLLLLSFGFSLPIIVFFSSPLFLSPFLFKVLSIYFSFSFIFIVLAIWSLKNRFL